jgi:hypothetical protein
MHKQTQSIRRQSDQYVDESELPFTASPGPTGGDGDSFATRRVVDSEPPGPPVDAKREPGNDVETGAE